MREKLRLSLLTKVTREVLEPFQVLCIYRGPVVLESLEKIRDG